MKRLSPSLSPGFKDGQVILYLAFLLIPRLISEWSLYKEPGIRGESERDSMCGQKEKLSAREWSISTLHQQHQQQKQKKRERATQEVKTSARTLLIRGHRGRSQKFAGHTHTHTHTHIHTHKQQTKLYLPSSSTDQAAKQLLSATWVGRKFFLSLPSMSRCTFFTHRVLTSLCPSKCRFLSSFFLLCLFSFLDFFLSFSRSPC